MLALAIALLLGAAPGRGPNTVAISYFDNNTGNPEFDPLGKGLADMLISDLSQVEALQIVEREKLNQVLAELRLSRSSYIDAKNAQKLGRGLSARYLMTGGYALSGETLRIDARVFRVETGAVLASEHAEGKKDEFFALEKELVQVLVGALKLKLAPPEKTRLHVNATQSFEAWKEYSAGLDAKDKGDDPEARRRFEAALAADPSYRAARSATERLEAIGASQDRQTEQRADQALTELDPKSKDFPRRIEALLRELDWTNHEQSKRKTTLLTWLAERDLLVCPVSRGPAPSNPHVIVDGVPSGGVISHCRQAYEVLLIAQELLDDPSTWELSARVCEYFIHNLPEDRAVLSYCRNTILSGIEDAKKSGETQERNSPRMKAMLRLYANKAPKH